MANDQKRKSNVRMADQPCPRSHNRSETCLVLPAAANPKAAEAALQQVMEDWLMPNLLDEFLKERGVTPKTRFSPKMPY